MNLEDISDRIQQHKLNAYDLIFTKDTREAVVVTPDFTLMHLQGKIDFYDSIEAAELALNDDVATYIGKMVAINIDGEVKGYITTRQGGFYRVMPLGIDDYDYLLNKPTINGTELVGNYDEIDPTVHDWAKEEYKPKYKVDEIDGAVDEAHKISQAEIDAMISAIF